MCLPHAYPWRLWTKLRLPMYRRRRCPSFSYPQITNVISDPIFLVPMLSLQLPNEMNQEAACRRMPGKPEVIGSSVGLVSTNAL